MLVEISRTFKDFSDEIQGFDLFSRTFQALKMRRKNCRTLKGTQCVQARQVELCVYCVQIDGGDDEPLHCAQVRLMEMQHAAETG